jgi:hypothetical protein
VRDLLSELELFLESLVAIHSIEDSASLPDATREVSGVTIALHLHFGERCDDVHERLVGLAGSDVVSSILPVRNPLPSSSHLLQSVVSASRTRSSRAFSPPCKPANCGASSSRTRRSPALALFVETAKQLARRSV